MIYLEYLGKQAFSISAQSLLLANHMIIPHLELIKEMAKYILIVSNKVM